MAVRPVEHATGAMVRASTDAFFGQVLSSHRSYPVLRKLPDTSMREVALTYAFESCDPKHDPHLDDWEAIARTFLLNEE